MRCIRGRARLVDLRETVSPRVAATPKSCAKWNRARLLNSLHPASSSALPQSCKSPRKPYEENRNIGDFVGFCMITASLPALRQLLLEGFLQAKTVHSAGNPRICTPKLAARLHPATLSLHPATLLEPCRQASFVESTWLASAAWRFSCGSLARSLLACWGHNLSLSLWSLFLTVRDEPEVEHCMPCSPSWLLSSSSCGVRAHSEVGHAIAVYVSGC